MKKAGNPLTKHLLLVNCEIPAYRIGTSGRVASTNRSAGASNRPFNRSTIGQISCILFYFLLFFSVSACSPKMQPKSETKSPYAFNFVESEQLMPVLAQAKAENKLVFVDFYTTWCLPCRIMEEEVFTDRKLAEFVNENFINYRTDAEKGNGVNLAAIFEIKAYPTLLFLDANGRVLVRKEGAISQTLFRQLAEQAQKAGE